MGALVAVRTRSVPWADWRRSSNVRTQRIVHIAAAFNSTWARGRWVRLRPERAQKLPYRFPTDSRSTRESPVGQGIRYTRAESLSVYSPIVAEAFIHPDFEIVRVHVFSHQLHTALTPPVPLSGLHDHVDRFQVIEDGVTLAVNVTDWALGMLGGAAVTFSSRRERCDMLSSCGDESPVLSLTTFVGRSAPRGELYDATC